ncbi:MAG: tetratricopeptide repeat protein [Flammeovirgaceae bacterium]
MNRLKTILNLLTCFLLVWQLTASAHAQKQPVNQKTKQEVKDTTTLIKELLADAQDFQTINNLSSSLENYLRVIRLLEKQQDTKQLAKTYEKVGDIYSSNNLYEKSIEYYLKANDINAKDLEVQAKLGNAYFQLENYNQSIDYYAHAIELCLQQGQRKLSLEFSEHIIACYHQMGNHEQALKNERIILETARNLGDSTSVATTFNNIGYAYKYLKDYKTAIQYFHTSLNMMETLELPASKQVPVLLNLGITYQNNGDFDNALKYLLKAIQLVEKAGNKKEIAKMYDLVASIYLAQKDYHNAQEYSRKAIQVGTEVNDAHTLRSSYLTSSLVSQQYDDYQKALEEYKVHLQINDSLLREERLRQQALLQQQLVFERSERELQQVIAEKEVSELARKQQELELEQQKKELELSKQRGELQAAQLAQQESEKERANQALLLTQQLLKTEKRERELAILRQQEALQKAEAQRKEEEAKRKELELRQEKDTLEQAAKLQEAERKQIEADSAAQRTFFISLAVFFLIVIALVLGGLRVTRKKNRTLAAQQDVIRERNVELSQMNEEIAAQRDMVSLANDQLNVALGQITDSVRYAKRIQDSILLPPMQIIQNFEDGFIYFEPRDIVSGDFYWYAKTESQPIYEEKHGFEGVSKIFKGIADEKHVIAAVDCTGHGVPGAFMSLIGNDLLNDIVNLQQITQADQILNELSKRVRRTLKQDQTSNQDGMDMALCSINYAAKEVEFAGAKNGLIYIQDGELHQIKGDKMSVGGRDLYKGQLFKSHTISIEKPTTFYIFSDGFQDQFGGPNNRKFMIKRFRELLFEIHQKPMKEQHELLENTLNEWRGKLKQLDDILVIGFKC